MNESQPIVMPIPPPGAERRRHSRYQYIERVYVIKKDGAMLTATQFEISEGGLSAATTTALLKVGDEVQLTPVLGEHVNAIVRRKQGTMYGFEFVGIPTKIQELIRKACSALPLFRSSVEI